MPTADIVVVGAGLSGLTAALVAARAGARVQVLARGHAATHWTGGGMEIAAPAGAATAADGIAVLAARPGHPYAVLASDLPAALELVRAVLALAGLPYIGALADPLARLPTAIGRTRPASVLPDAQAAGLRPWEPGERLVVAGPTGFKDFWPEAIAAGLRRPAVWGAGRRPGSVAAVSVPLPELGERHNLDGLRLARLFDDPAWRRRALDALARRVERAGGRGPGRVALPAVLGLDDHAAVLAEARERLPLEPFEVPLVPPSIPGLRLYQALRSALVAAGGRIQVGEPVAHVDVEGVRVRGVSAAAATREFRVRAGALILATGGLAGGGLVADDRGVVHETVLGLPVEAPPRDAWLDPDPFPEAGHGLDAAGIRTDAELRPLRADGSHVPAAEVRVVGSLLAGQRWFQERCGDGVAIASGHRAARSLASSLGWQADRALAPGRSAEVSGRSTPGDDLDAPGRETRGPLDAAARVR